MLAADLNVTSLTAPATAVSGDTIPIGWSVQNLGDQTASSDWFDGIYLSQDETFDTNDTPLVSRHAKYQSPLDGSANYSATRSALLPSMAAGEYYLIAVTDSSESQDEDDETNNQLTRPITVTSPDIDLRVTAIDFPAAVVSEDFLSISWTVTNDGIETTSRSWNDRVYLSADDVLDDDDRNLGGSSSVTRLAAGQSYDQSANIRVGAMTPGEQFILVQTDTSNQQAEDDESNNVLAIPVLVQAGDLTATNLTVVDSGGSTNPVSGGSIDVSWTISNIGDHEVVGSTNQSVIYSVDNVLDDGDRVLANINFSATDGLPPGSNANQTTTASLRNVPAGDGYIFVSLDQPGNRADADRDNQTTMVPVSVDAVDVEVSLVEVAGSGTPTTIIANSETTISWTVTNVGTSSIDTGWSDIVYYSSDNVLDPLTDQAIEFQQSPFGRRIEPSGSYTQSIEASFPNLPAGEGFLFVSAAISGFAEDSNPANNMQSIPISVVAADLRTDSLDVPSGAIAGTRTDVEWMVTNVSAATGAPGYWADQLYLSTDDVFDVDDILVGQNSRGTSSTLAPGSTYQADSEIILPSVTPGSYHLILVADGEGALGDAETTNNVLASPIDIVGSDLSVNTWDTPAAAINGEVISVSWSVQNNSSLPIRGGSYDRIFASSDNVFDPDDLLIDSTFVSLNDPLEAGATYQRSTNVSLRDLSPGHRFLILVTDAVDTYSDVDPTNNISVAPISVAMTNLTANAIMVPTTIATDQTLTASWTVENTGASPAMGSWNDRVYLSTDELLDASDRLMTSRGASGFTPLDAGTTYTQTADFSIQRAAAGDYFILIVANADASIGETNDGDNIAVAPITITVPDVEATSLGAPDAATLGETITITYTVTNVSSEIAAANWTDRIYLSNDETVDAIDDVTLVSVSASSQTPLQPGESYSVSREVLLRPFDTGDQFLLLRVDAGNAQIETSLANNTLARPINLSAPDLTVNDLTAPSIGVVGGTIDISYIVENQGAVPASSNWRDYVFLSDDMIRDLNDQQIGNFTRPNTLDASETYTNAQSVSLFNASPGEKYLIIETDGNKIQGETDETNNTFAIPITIAVPDLSITDSSAPATANLHEDIDISWTVTNGGSVEAPASWTDVVYLSTNNRLDASDRRLTTVSTGTDTPLIAGASYSRTVSTQITGFNIASGDVFLLIVTDDNQRQLESNENNNITAIPITIASPDLVVTNVSGPSEAKPGDEIEVSWTVQNIGDGPALADWSDFVGISDDQELSCPFECGEFDLDVVNADGFTPLAAGESYTQTMTFTVPQQASFGSQLTAGEYFLGVAADERFGSDQTESNESNNQRFVPITILPPDVDLQVTAFDAPTSAVVGEMISVEVTIINNGTEPATGQFGFLRDLIQLTDDSAGLARLNTIASRNTSDELPLAAGASYTFTIDVQIPASANAGDQYLVARADGFNNQIETDESNNFAIREIALSAPNLIVTDFTTPATSVVGGTFNVAWTVKNDSTIAALGDWSDSIYISDNNVLDNGDRRLTIQDVSGLTPLAAEEAYTANRQVTLNNINPGNRFLIIATDTGNAQGETNENDNVFIVPITIATTDLAISDVSGPTDSATGETIQVERTVTNTTDAAVSTAWTDAVFLSTDQVLDQDDIRIGTQSSSDFLPLAGQDSFTAPIFATVPAVTGGDYFLIVQINAFDNVFEFSRNNNTQSIPISIAAPDVSPSSLTVPATAISGDTISVAFSAENTTTIPAVADWRDAVFLSDDAVLDATDRKLASIASVSALAGGETYDSTVDVALPGVDAGDYFILVQIDDEGDQPETDETNNVISQPITIDAPNLTMVSTTAPSSATVHETVNVTFRVENEGTVPALNNWSDLVWISADESLSPDDRLVGAVSQSTRSPLAPTAVYESTIQINLPGDVSGDQFLLFQANGSGNQGETSRDDNVLARAITIAGPPNLSISDLSVPAIVAAGESVQVEYTVTNVGDSVAFASWSDLFELFESETAPDRQAFVGVRSRGSQTPPLAPGESERVTETIVIPRASGDLFFAVTANGNQSQSETTRDDNQLRVPISIQTPDITIASASSVATGTLGETITLDFTIDNPSGVVAAFDRIDQIYLSTDNVFDASDLPLVPGGIETTLPLAGGESVTRSVAVTLPAFPIGDRFLFVQLDPSDFQPETDETNNTSDAIPIELIASDLTVSNVSVAPQAIAGQAFVATWTVSNTGSAPISNWIDHVFLSPDNGIGNDSLVGEFPFSGTIMPGQSIVRSQGVTPPITVSGDRFVVVRTDGPNVKPEIDELNNAALSDDDVTIQSAPTPNLRVREVTTPIAEVDLLQNIQIDFVVENVGDGPTDVPYWRDAVYLSTDEIFDPTDVLIAQRYNPSFLDAGDAYSSSANGIVQGVSDGLFYVLVVTDARSSRVTEINGEGDNVTVGPQIRVNLPPPPDLVVEQIVVPASAFSGQLANLSWMTTNQGDATAFPEWNEEIYLSSDDFFDENDVRLATVRYTAIHDIVRTVTYAGDYETCFGVPAPAPTETVVFTSSDLLTASRANFNVFASMGGSRIVCTSGGTFVSEITSFELRSSQSRLDPGESVARSATVRLPEGISGEMKFVVVTDSSNRVNEFAFDENNATVAENATDVLLTPPPDLTIQSVIAPDNALAGTRIAVSYTATNDGATATSSNRWFDAIYLSQDDEFDPAVDTKVRDLRIQFGTGSVEVGETYTFNVDLDIPDGIGGDFYLFVVANDSADQFEADRSNNASSATGPITIALDPPDLIVRSISSDTEVLAGDTLAVQWTVTNEGVGPTRKSSWNDFLYRRLDDGSLQLLKRVPRRAALEPGESYQVLTSVQVPPDASGTWDLIVRTDGSQQILETGGEGNNDSEIQMTEVVLQASDLLTSGGTLALNDGWLDLAWTVTNDGAGGTNVRAWSDGIFLSRNDTFGDGDDTRIDTAYHSGRLLVDGTYDVTHRTEVPFGVEGDFYVFVRADVFNQVIESDDDTNNVHLIGQFSIDDLRVRPDLIVTDIVAPSEITAGDLVEIRWTVQNVGDPISTGDELRFEYDRGFWRDSVYLSRDQILDPQSDFYLGRVNGVRSNLSDVDLGGQIVQQYTTDGVFRVPRGLTGPLYVIVVTDRNDDVFEQSIDGRGESNNLRVSNDVLTATLRDPADLVVGNVTVPESVAAGGRVDIGYNIANDGAVPVPAFWTDRFYLSTDETFSLDDIDIGVMIHPSGEGIGVGESRDFNVSRSLPSILPGDYFVILRTDVFDVVRESDESNNLSVSLETFNISLPTLELTGPLSTTDLTAELAYRQSQSFYFQFNAAAGQSVAIDLTGNDIPGDAVRNSVSEISVAFERAPSATDYDQYQSRALVATLNTFEENRLVIPRTQEGTYYLRVDVRDRRGFDPLAPSTSTESATLALSVLPFSIFSAAPGVIGNTGPATIEIEASGINACSSAELLLDGELVASSTRMRTISPTVAHVTFDTAGLASGEYTIALLDHDGRVAEHPLTITDGVGPRVGGSINGPRTVRRGTSLFYANYGNNGDADAVAPLLLVRNLRTNTIALTQPGLGQNAEAGRVLQLMGISLSGDAGVLRPDELGSVPVFFDVDFTAGDYELEVVTAEDPRLFPFDAVESFFRPDDISDEDWSEPRTRLQQMIGDTWGSYVRALADVATRLGNIDSRTSDVRILIDDLVDLAIDPDQVRLSGTVASGAICTAIADATITAVDDSGHQHVVSSNVEGFFSFSNIGDGPFDLVIDAAGFAREVITDVVPADPAQNILVELEQESIITGQIELPAGQPNTGLVLVGATIVGSSDPTESFTVATRDDEFSLAGLKAGDYVVTVSQVGLVTQTFTVSIGAGETVDIGNVTLANSASVAGTVETAISGFDFSSVSVGAFQTGDLIATGFILDDGTYSIDGLAAGNYTIQVINLVDRYSTRIDVSLAAGQSLANAALEILPGSSVTGVVRDESGTPLTEVAVLLTGGDGKDLVAFSDDSGIYRFDQLPAGQYRVALPGSPATSVELADADGTIATADLMRIGTTRITGIVRDSSGSPLVGAVVQLRHDDQFVIAGRTNDEGQYAFLLNSGGSFDVVASYEGASFDIAQNVAVADDATTVHDFEAGSGAVRVSVTNATGDSVSELASLNRVIGDTLVPAGSAFVGPSGVVLFNGLVDGEYELKLIHRDGRGARASVIVSGGAVAEITTAFVERFTVSTVITDETGAPVPGARLLIYDGPQLRYTGIANADGNVLITGVFPGIYTTVVIADGFQSQIEETVEINDDFSSDVTMTASVESTVGRIVDGDSNPIGRGQVELVNADGMTVDFATVDVDGTFSLSGTDAADQQLRIISEGYAGQWLTGIDTTADSIGDVTLMSVGTIQGVGSLAIPDLPPTSEGEQSQAEGIGTIFTEIQFGIANYLFGDGDFAPLDDEPTILDLSDVEDCLGCSSELVGALQSVNLMRVIRDAAEELDGDVNYQRGIVLGIVGLETAVVLGAVAAFIVAIEGVVAAAAGTAAIGAGGTAVTSAGGAIGTSAASSSALTITYELVQVGQSVLAFKNIILAVVNSPDAAAAATSANTASDFFGNLSQSLNSLASVIMEASLNGSNGQVGATNVVSAASAIATFLNAVQFTETRNSLNLLASIEEQLANFKQMYLDRVDIANDKIEAYNECASDPEQCDPDGNGGSGGGGGGGDGPSPGDENPDNGSGDQPDDNADDTYQPQLVASSDPNDIIGPEGFGEPNWIGVDSDLVYTIRFENIAEATAAAQRVTITQQLDDDLDPRTFRVDDFGYSNTVTELPGNQPFFQSRQLLDDGTALDIFATVDTITGLLTWVFQTIDPLTGLPPADAAAGFLPPNDEEQNGEGFVSYRIRPNRDIASGDRIDAEATIIFDDNEPIDTPRIFNTIDAVHPVASIDALPATTPRTDFEVRWAGDDDVDGSGIRDYTVFVAVDGGPAAAWQSNVEFDSATFVGTPGRDYTFTVQARDFAGNVSETDPVDAATTRIATNAIRFPLKSADTAVRRGDDLVVAYDVATDTGTSFPLSIEFYAATADGTLIRRIGTDTFTESDSRELGKTITLAGAATQSPRFVVVRITGSDGNLEGLSTPTQTQTDQEILASGGSPWQNRPNRLDVSNDGKIGAIDALRVINELSRRVGTNDSNLGPRDEAMTDNFYDVTGDERITPLDALRIINALSLSRVSFGEGEQPANSFAAAVDVVFGNIDDTDDEETATQSQLF
tara:strand:+ start:128718 stop:144401 length:15684 start_codon:yes stop_codon:yes gene_type:complete